jgi:hypothetical protein
VFSAEGLHDAAPDQILAPLRERPPTKRQVYLARRCLGQTQDLRRLLRREAGGGTTSPALSHARDAEYAKGLQVRVHRLDRHAERLGNLNRPQAGSLQHDRFGTPSLSCANLVLDHAL